MKYLLKSMIPDFDFSIETEEYYTEAVDCDDIYDPIYEFARDIIYNWEVIPKVHCFPHVLTFIHSSIT